MSSLDAVPGPSEDRSDESLADRYPKYYKRIPADWKVIDVYGVHHLFKLPAGLDDSGALRHSSKKLLLPGCRTGGKTVYQEIKEARDTLNRWLELNKPAEAPEPVPATAGCTVCYGSRRHQRGIPCPFCIGATYVTSNQ